MNKEDFFVKVQEKWETEGNSTQAHEGLIEICYNIMENKNE